MASSSAMIFNSSGLVIHPGATQLILRDNLTFISNAPNQDVDIRYEVPEIEFHLYVIGTLCNKIALPITTSSFDSSISLDYKNNTRISRQQYTNKLNSNKVLYLSAQTYT